MIRCFNGRRGTRELRRATRPPSRKLSSCPCSHLSPKPSGRPALGRQALESSTRSYPRRCGPRSSPRLPVLKLQRLRSRLHRRLLAQARNDYERQDGSGACGTADPVSHALQAQTISGRTRVCSACRGVHSRVLRLPIGVQPCDELSGLHSSFFLHRGSSICRTRQLPEDPLQPDISTCSSAHDSVYGRLDRVSVRNRSRPCAVLQPVSYTHLTLPTNREV